MNAKTARVIAGAGVVILAVVLLIVLKDDEKSGGSDNSSTNPPAVVGGDGASGAAGDTTGADDTIEAAETDGNGAIGSDDTNAAEENATAPTIVVKNGKPIGGIRELEYDKGDQIHFKVSSDAAEEIHVHGYDLAKEVAAGATVSFDFPASIEGIFEAELEGLGVQIVELRVNP
jgi:hypothetical protein